MLYALVRAILRLAIDVFFRTVEVEGSENVPPTGPVVFAANHPNTFLDVVLVGAYLDRRLNFVAKAPLFKNPFAGLFLRALGAVPIERKIERAGGDLDPDAKAKNEKVLAECEETVARGGAVLIFPEGTSKADPVLLPLKTGTARIALGAQGRGPASDVTIVPVALHYDDRARFRSRARVRYGAPISVVPFREAQQKDEQAAVRALTTAIREGLEPGVFHLDDAAHEPLVQQLDAIYGRRLAGEEGRLSAAPMIARAVNWFAKKDPARIDRVRALLDDYQKKLAAAGLDDLAVRPGAAKPGPESTFALVATAPLWIWGLLHHLVPYQFPRIISSLLTKDPTSISTIKLMTGLVVFPAWYVFEGWLAWRYLGTSWAVVHAGTLPVAGVVALLAAEGLESRARLRTRERARRRAGRETVVALREARAALVAELDRARAEILVAAPDAGEAEASA